MEKRAKCPIEGCNFAFSHGITGWDKHIGCVANHPHYREDITDHAARLDAFRTDFPAFFRHSSRPPKSAAKITTVPPPPPFQEMFRAIAKEEVRAMLVQLFGEGSIP